MLFEVDVPNVQSTCDRNDEKRCEVRQKYVLPIRADSDPEREDGKLKETNLPPSKRAVAENVHIQIMVK